MVGIVNKI